MALQPIEGWRLDLPYLAGAVVVHSSRAWRATQPTAAGEEPGVAGCWTAVAPGFGKADAARRLDPRIGRGE